jgi:hypothetical protein
MFDRFRTERGDELNDLLECIYKTGPKEYYYCDINSSDAYSARFERFSKNDLREKLEAFGFPFCLRRYEYWGSEDRVERDKFFEELFSEVKTVDYAGPLAGYVGGSREYNGTKILVTRANWTCIHDELEKGRLERTSGNS